MPSSGWDVCGMVGRDPHPDGRVVVVTGIVVVVVVTGIVVVVVVVVPVPPPLLTMKVRSPASASLVNAVPGGLFQECADNVTGPLANRAVSTSAPAVSPLGSTAARAIIWPLAKTSTFT